MTDLGGSPLDRLRATSLSLVTHKTSGRVSVSLTLDRTTSDENLSVQMGAITEVDSFWVAEIPVTRRDDDLWSGELDLMRQDQGARLIEIAVTQPVSESGDSVAQPVAVPDSLRYHWERAPGEAWASGNAARGEMARRLSAQREIDRAEVSGADSSGGSYAAVLLVQDLLLTVRNRARGISLYPLTDPSVVSPPAELFSGALQQLGHLVNISPESWHEHSKRPAAVAYIPNARGASPAEAGGAAVQRLNELLDLLALQRGARGSIIDGVVVAQDASDAASPDVHRLDLAPPYRGNLVGGFISGEDSRTLIENFDRVRTDPRVRLWLSLHADALGELRADVRFFRLFSLLESIARAIVPSDATAQDRAGIPFETEEGEPYSIKQARGAMYLLGAHVEKVGGDYSWRAGCTDSPRGHLADPTVQAVTSWEMVGIWVRIRNTVAHDGTIRGQAPRGSERARLQRKMSSLSIPPGNASLVFSDLTMALIRLAESVMRLAVAGRL